MCLSWEVEDKWNVFTEFMIFFTLLCLDIGSHAGIFIMVHQKVESCAKLVSHTSKIPCYKNANGTISYVNNTLDKNWVLTVCDSNFLYCAGGGNGTATALRDDQKHLALIHYIFLAILCLGGLFFVVHVALLLPNLFMSFKEKDMDVFRETAPPIYKHVLKFHVLFLILETIFFDIPSGGIVMEFIAQLWKAPNNFNCWECATSLAAVPAESSLSQSKVFLALTCVGIAFIALYKGMLPLYLWIGNPFCFPCVPLRLLVVLPGGLIALVMTLGPIFGIAKKRLIPYASVQMLAQVQSLGNTFFSIVIHLFCDQLCFLVTPLAGTTTSTSIADNSTVASLIFVGDISFAGPVKYFVEEKQSCDYPFLFKNVKDQLSKADFRVGNLECALLSNNNTAADADLERKLIVHSCSDRSIEGLKYAGFDLLKLANNHFSDFGVTGMRSTIRALESAGIGHVGVADSKKNFRQEPVVKIINGVRIGFLAYCQQKEGCERLYSRGPAVYNQLTARKEVKALKKSVDIVIVLLHWSKEYLPVPPKGVRDLAKSLYSVGADLIVGDHPHVVQGHECIKKTMVVYSLGNFLFLRTNTGGERFLKSGGPTVDDVSQHIKKHKTVYNPTQFSYMFRVKLSRSGIVEAEYLQLEIKHDDETNCIQPTPVTGNWEKFCDKEDYYCFDYRSICDANSEMMDEGMFQERFVNRNCIIGSGQISLS
eukprot:gene16832-18530_t